MYNDISNIYTCQHGKSYVFLKQCKKEAPRRLPFPIIDFSLYFFAYGSIQTVCSNATASRISSSVRFAYPMSTVADPLPFMGRI